MRTAEAPDTQPEPVAELAERLRSGPQQAVAALQEAAAWDLDPRRLTDPLDVAFTLRNQLDAALTSAWPRSSTAATSWRATSTPRVGPPSRAGSAPAPGAARAPPASAPPHLDRHPETWRGDPGAPATWLDGTFPISGTALRRLAREAEIYAGRRLG